MTALVWRKVKRTFSEILGHSTGLPRLKTHEAGRQDFGEFNEGFWWLRCHLGDQAGQKPGSVYRGRT